LILLTTIQFDNSIKRMNELIDFYLKNKYLFILYKVKCKIGPWALTSPQLIMTLLFIYLLNIIILILH